MRPDQIPQELLDILDRAAGKTHSRDGNVAAALAEILTRYDEIKAAEARKRKAVSVTFGPIQEPPPRIVPVPVVWPMYERPIR